MHIITDGPRHPETTPTWKYPPVLVGGTMYVPGVLTQRHDRFALRAGFRAPVAGRAVCIIATGKRKHVIEVSSVRSFAFPGTKVFIVSRGEEKL